MEIVKSTVKSVQGNGTYESKFGMLYKFEIFFSDGKVCEYSSKKSSKDDPAFFFKEGKEVAFEYDASNPKYPKCKPYIEKPGTTFVPNNNNTLQNQPKTDFTGGQPTIKQAEQINVQNAIILQNSFTQANSFLKISGFSSQDKKLQLQQLTDVCDQIYKYMIDKLQNKTKSPSENQSSFTKDAVNDLPF